MTESVIVGAEYEVLYKSFINHPVNDRTSISFYRGEKELEQARKKRRTHSCSYGCNRNIFK